MALVTGTASNDNLIGTSYMGVDLSDEIYGYGGDDNINGGGGSDTIYGGDGNDIILGDGTFMDPYISGVDTIYGGAGNDVIVGGVAGDYLYGEDGDDTFINYGVGAGRYDGGAGTDIIYIEPFNGWDGGHSGYSALQIGGITGIEAIVNNSTLPTYIMTEGGSYDFRGILIRDVDQIQGDELSADTIYAEKFYDTSLSAYSGANVDGRGGNDLIVGSTLGDTLTGGAGDDEVSGGGGADTISGGDGGDVLYGDAANDIITGGAGTDFLVGGVGDDFLTGGAGTDYFVFGAADGTDIVSDFTNGTDIIYVGPDVSTVNVYNYGGQALLELDSTYVLLTGIAPSAIDGSDFYLA